VPRRTRDSIDEIADRRLEEADQGRDRFAELQLDWINYAGERLVRFGGVWDKTLKDFVEGKDAAHSRVVRVHPGQEGFARWFDEWVGVHTGAIARTAPPVYSCLLAGGRRGGKSMIGVNAGCAYAVAVPDSITWIVSPSDSYYDEIVTYIEECLPRHWYQDLGKPHYTYFLGNGSKIILRSGFHAGKLKKGRADFVVINEGQQVEERSMGTVSAAIIDKGGLVLTCANPPDVGDDGTWVADMASECRRGLRKHARFFFFDPEMNPEIDQAALHAQKETMSEHEYAVQIKGEFRLPPDAVLHAWDQAQNEQPVPDIAIDVTADFTKAMEGRSYDDIVSVDVQSYPWIAAIRWRAYRNPALPNIVEQSLLWGIGEVFLDQGDEVDVSDELKTMGMVPDRTLVIVDASAEWQQANRSEELQRAQYKGKGSADMFRGEGFRFTVPPDRYMKANPDIADRCRAANARIATASGRRLVFVDPEKCPRTVAAVRSWKVVGGKPSRHSKFAHGGDALSYMIWRFFPRRRGSGKFDPPAVVPRTRGRDRMRGY
jgi:hypothetical protein